MRNSVTTASAVAISLAATLLGGAAANAASSDPTCTTYMTNDRSTISLDAKIERREIHYVAHLYESTPGCYSTYYDVGTYPGALGLNGQHDSGYTINYVGNNEFDVTQVLNYNRDAERASWIGESRDDYDDETDPGYINPDSGAIDIRGHGYVATRVTVKRGVRTITATAKRYSDIAEANVAWSRGRVSIQELKGGRWVAVRTAAANTKGAVTAKVKTGRHQWRAVVAASDIAWGAASKAVAK